MRTFPRAAEKMHDMQDEEKVLSFLIREDMSLCQSLVEKRLIVHVQLQKGGQVKHSSKRLHNIY